jgi:hypothetical protein
VGLASQDPEIASTLLKAFARSWAGTTPEEFDAQVRVWLETVKQPKLGKLYIDLVYQPMLGHGSGLLPSAACPRHQTPL